MKNIFSIISSSITTFVIYYLGGLDIALKILISFVILDYITGLLKAIYNKKLNSNVGAKGIIKKLGYFILVAVAFKLDQLTGNSGAIRTLVIYFFVANEGLSIIENWGKMGLPLPQKLIDVLEQLRNNKGDE